MEKRIAILGSTGSIGTQALEVIDKLSGTVIPVAFSAGENIPLLREQIKKYKPAYVSVKNESDAAILLDEFPGLNVFFGEEGLSEIAGLNEIDMLLVAVSGKNGLKPVIKAIHNKKNIALANKETLVTAGDIIMKLARENGVDIIPVDSEHSAIFQCLNGKNKPRKLIITASGGPFLNFSKQEIENADLKGALAHPRWKMGKKITVDSATLMNKGLEVIEAHHLFDMDYDDIKIVIHPQSYVHSAVEFDDGSVIAQIGNPSMHIPVQYALTYPERFEGVETESFDFVKASKFEFFEPDFEKFPSLELALDAGRTGGTATVCLNAADEEAVFAFLEGKIKFTDIYGITEKMYTSYSPIFGADIDTVIAEDEAIRIKTREMIKEKATL